MTVAIVHSAGLHGIDAFLVRVEADLAGGQIPGWQMVGLPENAVKESKDRVLTALRNIGYATPSQKVTINLSPASTKKDGTAFDLPIALSLLTCQGIIAHEHLENMLFFGELSLDAQVKGVNGVLAVSLLARQLHIGTVVVPDVNADEAAVVDGVTVYGIQHLSELLEHLHQPYLTPRQYIPALPTKRDVYCGDFSEIRGQHHAKRAFEIAASGNHNLILSGPPGTGKSMLCQRLPTILPPLSFDEALETTKIYSRLGLIRSGQGLLFERPFRSPHHSVSDAGLIGGGSIPRPGEVSLAHHGVLFLDELPEFKRHVLELLRQPLEEGRATITRAHSSLDFPARFILAAAMNPCPCGYLGHGYKPCVCSDRQVREYQNRISGPLLDRIDLHIELAALKPEELLSGGKSGDSSEQIRERVCHAREIQRERFNGENFCVNAQMRIPHLQKFCSLSSEVKKQVYSLLHKDKLSARGYHRMLKVTRTIADLAGQTDIALEHVLEAYQYRSLGV